MNIIRYINLRANGFTHRAAESLSDYGDSIVGKLAVIVVMWIVVTAIIDSF